MNNDIDRLFQKNLSGLESNPPGVDADVAARWARVEAQLEEKRKRRIAWWIPAAAAALLLLIALRWLLPQPAPENLMAFVTQGTDTLKQQIVPLTINDLTGDALAPRMALTRELHTDPLPKRADAKIVEYEPVMIHEPRPIMQFNTDSRSGFMLESIKAVQNGVSVASIAPKKGGKHKMAKGKMPKRNVTSHAFRHKRKFSIHRATRRKLSPQFKSNTNENPSVEEYAPLIENEFRATRQEPLSTFSIDVDAASYANIRRKIMQEGQLPPKDAVRIEEMLNYFNYEYAAPNSDVPFSVTTELSECPWNPRHQLLLIGMQGRQLPPQQMPASNLVFLLDVSGSMEESNKLPLVKQSITRLVEQLREQDRVSIVVYAGAAGLVLPPTPGNRKADILDALNRLSAGGSTAGGEGIELAYKTAKENFMPDGNNRIILCTDGDFNVGISTGGGLEELITRKREEGVFLSVLGFGTGNLKDNMMELLADKGNGNYAYIDSEREGEKVFGQEFGGTLFTIAKDVKLQVEWNPTHVKGYRLIGYENRLLRNEDFANDKVDAGELGAGHRVTALYEIIPAGSSEQIPGTEALRYERPSKPQDKSMQDEVMFLKLRYKDPKGTTSKLVQFPIPYQPMEESATSANFRWAAAVSTFGHLLRQSKFIQHADYDLVLDLARSAQGSDPLRTEFVEMVERAKQLGLEAKK